MRHRRQEARPGARAAPAAQRAVAVRQLPPVSRVGSSTAATLDARLARAERLGHRPAALRIGPDPVRARLQRMKNKEEASTRAKDWLKLGGQEREIIAGINEKLRTFSTLASLANYEKANEAVVAGKKRLQEIDDANAKIVGEYLEAGGEVRTAFIQEVFADLPEEFGKGKYEPEELEDEATYDAAWLQKMFDALAAKTQAASEEEEPYRRRYLAYALQSLNDPIGANQIRHLLALLGDERTLAVAEGVKTDMSAGPKEWTDNPKVTKTDAGGKDDDAGILEEVEGNLYEFMRRKYGEEIAREANDKASEVKEFQINLDKETFLFPIFSGISEGRLILFTTPKFMAVHHENGHLITMMQGKAGIGDQHLYKEALVSLTKQEEAYNIFGSKRSDRAYSEKEGLPVRFDHKTLLTYMQGSDSWEAFAGLLAKGSTLTGNLPALQERVAKQLRDVVDANWSSKTWGPKKKKPKGITAIGEAMDQVEGALAKLTAAQKKAADANEEDSFWRTKLSKAFYQAVAEVQPGQARSVLKLESDLAGISAQL